MIASLDLATKSIILDATTVNSDIHPVEIYREVRELRRLNESYRIFDMPITGKGADPKGGGKYTERYFILNNGWRIVPYDISHVLTVTGVIITDDGFEGVYAFDRSSLSPSVYVDINYVPQQVEIIEVAGGGSADPAAIVEELMNTNVHTYNTQSTIGDVFHRITYLEQRVYVNTELVSNGDGSQSTPYNNFVDAKDECELRGISTIVLAGEATLTSSLKNFHIYGIGTPRIDLNGQDCKNSTFYQCSLSGTYVNNIIVRDSILENGLNLSGYFHNSMVLGTVIVAPNAQALVTSCMSGNVDGTISAISMNSLAPSDLNVQGYSGRLLIKNCDDAGDRAIIDMAQGVLELENTNVAGSIVASGNCKFIDNSNGSTVTDFTVNEKSDIISVTGVPVASIDEFKADLSGIDLSSVPAAVWSYTTRELTVAAGLTPAQEAKLDAIPTAAENATAVWEYNIPDFNDPDVYLPVFPQGREV